MFTQKKLNATPLQINCTNYLSVSLFPEDQVHEVKHDTNLFDTDKSQTLKHTKQFSRYIILILDYNLGYMYFHSNGSGSQHKENKWIF